MQLERVCSTEILPITLTLLWVFLFLFAVFQIENLRAFNNIKRVGVEVECFISLKIVLHFRHSLAVFTSKLLKTSRSCTAQNPRCTSARRQSRACQGVQVQEGKAELPEGEVEKAVKFVHAKLPAVSLYVPTPHSAQAPPVMPALPV